MLLCEWRRRELNFCYILRGSCILIFDAICDQKLGVPTSTTLFSQSIKMGGDIWPFADSYCHRCNQASDLTRNICWGDVSKLEINCFCKMNLAILKNWKHFVCLGRSTHFSSPKCCDSWRSWRYTGWSATRCDVTSRPFRHLLGDGRRYFWWK